MLLALEIVNKVLSAGSAGCIIGVLFLRFVAGVSVAVSPLAIVTSILIGVTTGWIADQSFRQIATQNRPIFVNNYYLITGCP